FLAARLAQEVPRLEHGWRFVLLLPDNGSRAKASNALMLALIPLIRLAILASFVLWVAYMCPRAAGRAWCSHRAVLILRFSPAMLTGSPAHVASPLFLLLRSGSDTNRLPSTTP